MLNKKLTPLQKMQQNSSQQGKKLADDPQKKGMAAIKKAQKNISDGIKKNNEAGMKKQFEKNAKAIKDWHFGKNPGTVKRPNYD